MNFNEKKTQIIVVYHTIAVVGVKLSFPAFVERRTNKSVFFRIFLFFVLFAFCWQWIIKKHTRNRRKREEFFFFVDCRKITVKLSSLHSLCCSRISLFFLVF